MSGTTPKLAIPYVVPGDALTDFPALDLARATLLDNKLPRRIDYKAVTANLAVTATTEATAQSFITGNNVAFSGTQVRCKIMIPMTQLNVSGGRIVLFRDSTVIGQWSSGASANGSPFFEEVLDTPPAGNHIYTVKAFTSGANTLTLSAGAGGAGALLPAFLEIVEASL